MIFLICIIKSKLFNPVIQYFIQETLYPLEYIMSCSTKRIKKKRKTTMKIKILFKFYATKNISIKRKKNNFFINKFFLNVFLYLYEVCLCFGLIIYNNNKLN